MKKTDVFLKSCVDFDRDNFNAVNKKAVVEIIN